MADLQENTRGTLRGTFVDIIDEVVEDVQHEKLMGLWQRYKIYIYSSIGCVIIGTALYGFWKEHEEKEIHQASTLYAKALKFEERNNFKDAQKIFEDVTQSSALGIKALGELSLSALFEKLSSQNPKEIEKAQDILKNLAESSSSPDALRRLGRIKLILLAPDSEISKEELEKLLSAKNQTWSFLGQEIKASQEYHRGNLEKSLELYENLLKNTDTPHGIRQRALRMFMILKSKGLDASLDGMF